MAKDDEIKQRVLKDALWEAFYKNIITYIGKSTLPTEDIAEICNYAIEYMKYSKKSDREIKADWLNLIVERELPCHFINRAWIEDRLQLFDPNAEIHYPRNCDHNTDPSLARNYNITRERIIDVLNKYDI